MPDRPDRRVSLALTLPDGTPLGTAPEFAVPGTTYWPDARTVAAAAATAWGSSERPVILRLADVHPADGSVPERVVYTAEVSRPPAVPLTPADPALFIDEPLRMPWARPGGAAARLEWAHAQLASIGMPQTGAAEQIRTWNLSSLWRIPTTEGIAWLKEVPPFFAHEGAVLDALQPFAVPRLLARATGVCLLTEIPGEDLYRPDEAQACAMVDLLVDLQTQAALPTDVRQALPDWSPQALAQRAEHTLRQVRGELDSEEAGIVSALIDGLDDLEAQLDSCGIRNTLVHGDFHPGNLRGHAEALVLLDWGDSGFGNPLLDHAAFTERLSPETIESVTQHWLAAWQRAIPGSDPARALALVGPVGALRQAIIYQGFLDGIEPSEHIYHRRDPGIWLRRTAVLARPR